jgi:hypothetical protein
MPVLIASVNAYPYNWSAWLEIITCAANYETASIPIENFLVKMK